MKLKELLEADWAFNKCCVGIVDVIRHGPQVDIQLVNTFLDVEVRHLCGVSNGGRDRFTKNTIKVYGQRDDSEGCHKDCGDNGDEAEIGDQLFVKFGSPCRRLAIAPDSVDAPNDQT